MTLAQAKPPPGRAPIRVIVVDDSAVVRGYIARILEGEPGIDVIATCANGQMAVQQSARTPADVIILDVEMPVMDGLTAVPKLLAVNPSVRIVMASTLTQRNAGVSLDALARGAADYLPKPATSGISTNADFRRELLAKVIALGSSGSRVSSEPVSRAVVKPRPVPSVALRRPAVSHPQALVIGSSTGGPQALIAVLSALSHTVTPPILIAQHMPATFTAILAQHIARASGRPCAEGVDGAILRHGSITLAPGDFHMEVARDGAGTVVRLHQGAPENFCRPSVNPLFRSAARLYGADVCALMLTGMGSDGLDGTRALAAAGAPVVAQDEATSVVWGMPGAIATAGLCTAILPLPSIAGHLADLFGGRA